MAENGFLYTKTLVQEQNMWTEEHTLSVVTQNTKKYWTVSQVTVWIHSCSTIIANECNALLIRRKGWE